MAKNDVVLLDSLLNRLAPRFGTSLADSGRFELFAFDQLLKPYDPTYEDLSIGWVDGGNDGGIDGFFVYVDGRPYVGNATNVAARFSPSIQLLIVTARSSAKFEQQPLDALHTSLSELLDLTKQNTDLLYPYNADVLRQRNRFSSAYVELVDRISREGNNFVVLVKLADYFAFVSDENGDLRRYLFESNVRDYLGQGQVNRDIAATLSRSGDGSGKEDFWWLNNGVTLLCTSATDDRDPLQRLLTNATVGR